MRQLLALVLATPLVLPTAAAPVAAQAQVFDCQGAVRTESIFEAGAASTRERRWTIVVSDRADYVKRPPEIAAGCVEPTIEVCGCKLGTELVRCRSLGISAAGVEVGMDFSIDRRSRQMTLSGRRYDPASGQLIETSGELACDLSERP